MFRRLVLARKQAPGATTHGTRESNHHCWCTTSLLGCVTRHCSYQLDLTMQVAQLCNQANPTVVTGDEEKAMHLLGLTVEVEMTARFWRPELQHTSVCLYASKCVLIQCVAVGCINAHLPPTYCSLSHSALPHLLCDTQMLLILHASMHGTCSSTTSPNLWLVQHTDIV